jgi:uncharacterized membrane protein
MDRRVKELAEHLLQTGYDDLPERERRVLSRIAGRLAVSTDVNSAFHESRTLGARVADRVAAFGGSWTFIFLFGGVILVWVGLNVALMAKAVDPYPFVFLNLILSMLAAVQAPIIMMSQNRQAEKDRLAMAHDYEVNLKAELEIMSLHEKVDDIRMRVLTEGLARIEARLDQIGGQART